MDKQDEKKIVVWIPFLSTTMEINEKDFNPAWMVKSRPDGGEASYGVARRLARASPPTPTGLGFVRRLEEPSTDRHVVASTDHRPQIDF